MLIIAGQLLIDAAERSRYLDAVADVARAARAARGCLDFVQAGDPIDDRRINVFERWASDEDLDRFRAASDPPIPDLPAVLDADVAKYRIAAVEAP